MGNPAVKLVIAAQTAIQTVDAQPKRRHAPYGPASRHAVHSPVIQRAAIHAITRGAASPRVITD